jgi:hypothetical protein
MISPPTRWLDEAISWARNTPSGVSSMHQMRQPADEPAAINIASACCTVAALSTFGSTMPSIAMPAAAATSASPHVVVSPLMRTRTSRRP